jgi:integrase
MTPRTGYVYKHKGTGTWYARVTYTDTTGKRRNVQRRADSKSHGRQVLKALVRTLEEGGPKAIDAERLTMADLCDYYEKHYATPAQYVNGRKVAGLRSVVTVLGYVGVFREHFGKRPIKGVSYEDLRAFRMARLSTPTHQSLQRSLTTVNRELAYLRRMLTVAERNGWLQRNPFKLGDSLIHAADEVRRERIISRDEETRLLAACNGSRAHLRSVIIAALDTGCRLGELRKLQWSDIDLTERLITIQAFNTKTARSREVSITTRLALALEELGPQQPASLVFRFSNVRAAFQGACIAAGLAGLRFHDLRHTHASRLDDLGFSLAKIGNQLGHTVLQTTLRYVNRDRAAVRKVAAALDGLNETTPAGESEAVH